MSKKDEKAKGLKDNEVGQSEVDGVVVPKIRLCWMCNRQFRGNHFTTRTIQGHERELHKACAEDYDRDPDY